MKLLLFLAALLCGIAPAFCQANWGYYLEFSLADSKGELLTPTRITSGEYQIFCSTSYGVYTHLSYIKTLGRFSLNGDATTTNVAVGLVHGQDTTVVYVLEGATSRGTVLTSWPRKPGFYSVEPPVNVTVGFFWPASFGADKKPSALFTVTDWNRCRLENNADDANWNRFFHSKELSSRFRLTLEAGE